MNATITNDAKTEVTIQFNSALKRYATLKEKFVSRVSENPVQAVTWDAEELVQAQAVYEVWMKVVATMDTKDALQAIEYGIGACEQLVESFFGHSHSDLYTTAVARTKATQYSAMSRLLKDLHYRYAK